MSNTIRTMIIEERERLDRALSILDGEIKRPGRPRKNIAEVPDATVAEVLAASVVAPHRRLTAAARKRISAAQKKRWATARSGKK